ncbi:MAG TPA: hypothetical protein VLM76_15140 [Patescibacteria group bacterium]|nr:hypothetical protein [Patescibacteria group bacterium]
MAITETRVKLVLGAIAAVAAFLLVQTDVALEPAVRVALGAVIVALAVLNPEAVKNRLNG